MSLFERAELAPADPILGLTEAFTVDKRAQKVNLGVGVYLDEDGRLPLMRAVQEASERITQAARPHAYQPIDGMPAYRTAVRAMVFGESDAISDGRVVTVQSLGGTGALRVGGDLLRVLSAGPKLLVSNPSWENHRAIFSRAGFEVDTYRYYDAELKGIDFEGMIADLDAAEAGTVVVLHACCHNPTGYDLDAAQWDRVIEVLIRRSLVPFLDMAYQGFGSGVAEDGAVVERFTSSGLVFLLSTSYSKSFSLYGERVGSLSVVVEDATVAARVLSQLKTLIRTDYSNPPTEGAAIVSTVLLDEQLRSMWADELSHMRTRIQTLRTSLVAALAERGIDDMEFIAQQRGMFSYSGLPREQMVALRSEFGVYGLDSGRICVAALNDSNLGYVADAIASVRAASPAGA